MCGRFTLRARLNDILAQFDASAVRLDDTPLFERYNIPPTSDIPVVRTVDGNRQLSLMRWGLLPSWTKDIKKAPMLNNARAETVTEKPSFSSAYKHRRCIIPATGFFEWLTEGKNKQPFYFHRPDGKLLAFAGLWETWNNIDTCTIVTTGPNEVMEPVHDRMPVILGDNDYSEWLDTNKPNPSHLLAPCPASEITSYPVDKFVNAVRNEGERCIEPISLTSNVLFD
jgi:putative SOS response-associated peptidase YedK